MYEVEIFCWDQKPMINLYAKEQVGGLTKDWIAQAEGTWSLSLSSGISHSKWTVYVFIPTNEFWRH
ncbi:hypothetical protein HED50_22605 [Ochrobactrum oryzae]|nr:hypothetical protein [Brucella oryzae]